MEGVKINLNTFDKVLRFIHLTDELDCKLHLISGNYITDVKSFLGIFCLDLSMPIEVKIMDNKRDLNKFTKAFKEFVI